MAEGTDSKLANRILIGLVVGAAAGAITLLLGAPFPRLLEGARTLSTAVLDPLGQVFLRMLFFVVIPLIFASLAIGVAQLGELQAARAARGAHLLAVLPEHGDRGGARPRHDERARARAITSMRADEGAPAWPSTAARRQARRRRQAAPPDMTPTTIVEMFMPRNLFGAFVGNDRNVLGDVLPLILFAILVGAAGVELAAANGARSCRHALEHVNELMTGIVHFALRLAPYAVPAMIYSVVVKIGWDILIALGVFVLGCAA